MAPALILVAIVACLFRAIQAYNIPQELIHCYRGNFTQPSVGFNQQLLLELIRKVEEKNPTTLDMRMLSVELIHRLRIDGIEKAPGLQETEFVTPYSTRGIMVPKYKLLLQLVSNIPGTIEFDKFLSPWEICLLHRLLSSTVEPFQRGDERTSCPAIVADPSRNAQAPWITQNKSQMNQTTGTTFERPLSRCPLEGGTYRSFQYGSIAPGVLVMSIAAGLQPQNVRISEFISAYKRKGTYENLETMERADTRKQVEKLLSSMESIDNTYVVGLAGDLAEVCLYQGPYVGTDLRVGLQGNWNDTFFPRLRFLADNHEGRWEMTDSELLSGIDGYFLAQQVPYFVNKVRRLRLSQVLDMYYSNRGIPVVSIENLGKRKLPNIKQTPNGKLSRTSELNEDSLHRMFNADRKTKLWNVFSEDEAQDPHGDAQNVPDDINRACYRKQILQTIDKDRLKQETFNFVQVLQYTTGSVVVEDSLMRRNCDAAVDRFFSYASNLLDSFEGCTSVGMSDTKPIIDLLLVIDGSRSVYENLRMIFHLSELIDVSIYGSSISVINGQSGEFMVNQTRSLSSVFEQLSAYQGSYPSALSLSKSFDSIIRTLSSQMDEERAYRTVGANAPVILVISQGARIVNSDFVSARRMLTSSFEQFPDLYFVFLTNDAATFSQLTDFSGVSHSRVPIEEHYKIIESPSIDPQPYSGLLQATLKAIPQRLVAPFCRTEANRKLWRTVNVREEHEQYLSPGVELRYRISRNFLFNTGNVGIQFQNSGYGEFTVCGTMDSSFAGLACQTTTPENDNVWFNFTGLCSGEPGIECRSLYFLVQMETSNMKCTENDCRYPDQVRFVIKHEGLRCPSDGSGARSLVIGWILPVFAMFLTIRM
ncbi:AAEL012007-PA [Aedes aegypti]|uniref:AAEL012007-PA n=1 Tax=Aedes aegypti TaxID=7159 RepID=Q16NE4_AEDAE|nr:AAEL012007-PA [Aedes aegypti]